MSHASKALTSRIIFFYLVSQFQSGGVARAFESWQMDLKTKEGAKENFKLPGGLEKYSSEQLFYLGFSQVWCGSIRYVKYEVEGVQGGTR